MIDLEERLRSEMARTATEVRAFENPMGRLLARRRRRRQSRAVALVAVVAAALTAGALAVRPGAAPPGPGVDGTPPAPHRSPPVLPGGQLTPWLRRLLDSPTRGNLAGNTKLVADLTGALAGKQRRWGIDPSLTHVKLLLLDDVTGARMFRAAYYNDSRALELSVSGPAGTTVTQLVDGEYGGGVAPLQPFTFGEEGVEPTGKPSYYFVAALAPAGCQIATSTAAQPHPDGTVSRTWTNVGDYLVRPGRDTPTWWRVTCDGVVRQAELGAPRATHTVLGGNPVTERGHVDPAVLTAALAQWQVDPGLPVDAGYRALWGGTPPGGDGPVVVLTGASTGGGVQVCAVTGHGRYPMLGMRYADPDGFDGVGPDGSVVTTAVAGSADLVAVRLPAPGSTTLSNRLLVVAPPGAARLRIGGAAPQTMTLVDGVAVVTAKAPANLTLQAVDAKGRVLAASTVAEPGADGELFGEPVINRW